MIVAQLGLTLCNPMDCSSPGCSVHGISQARILEWVALHSLRGSSQPRDQTRASFIGRQVLYHLSHLRNPSVASQDAAVATGLEKVNPHPNSQKGSTKECANLWTTAFISHASKLMPKILHARLQHYVK